MYFCIFIITECDERCYHHGICQQGGVCSCLPGWNGKFCSLSGCPHNCLNRGQCKQIQGLWKCICDTEYTGEDCSKSKEQECGDGVDNDLGLSFFFLYTYFTDGGEGYCWLPCLNFYRKCTFKIL